MLAHITMVLVGAAPDQNRFRFHIIITIIIHGMDLLVSQNFHRSCPIDKKLERHPASPNVHPAYLSNQMSFGMANRTMST